MLASNTAVLRSLNLASSSSSRAKILTMREPTTFSCATVVTSAIFCCTSFSTGFRRRLKRSATASKAGKKARPMKASFQLRKKSSTVMAVICTTLVVKKMRP